MKFSSIVQSAVIGPVQLTIEPSHRLFGWTFRPIQRPVTDKTQHTHEISMSRRDSKNSSSKLGAAETNLRPRGHWDRMFMEI